MRKITHAEWLSKPEDYRSFINGVPHWLTRDEQTGATVLEPVEILDAPPPRVYRYNDPAPGAWQAFIAAMRSGAVFECDEEMYFYWLEVLPPAWMRRRVTIGGKPILTHFGFAEGAERVVAFWREGDRYFGCQTDILNPHA
ncbi:MAG TPA: hypothetical protein VH575_12875 [Gemmataceae bacterium]|jgi:hypothetical protein